MQNTDLYKPVMFLSSLFQVHWPYGSQAFRVGQHIHSDTICLSCTVSKTGSKSAPYKKDSIEYDEVEYSLSWPVSNHGLLDLPDVCCLGSRKYNCEETSTAPCSMLIVAGRGGQYLTWALINDRFYKVLSLSDVKEGVHWRNCSVFQKSGGLSAVHASYLLGKWKTSTEDG